MTLTATTSRKPAPALIAGLLLPLLLVACAGPGPGDRKAVDARVTGPKGCTAPGCAAEIASACGGLKGRETIITCAHNVVRRTVAPPPAAPLQPVRYDKVLAEVAQRWANKCTFAHSATGGLVGENIHVSSNFEQPVEEAVISWAAESEFYNLGKNACRRGEACGHYTQLVWAGTDRVGCGFAICQTDAAGKISYAFRNIVCNYAPPGNYVGELPYVAK